MNKRIKLKVDHPKSNAFDVVGIEFSDSFMDKLRYEIRNGSPIPPHLLEDSQDLPLGEQEKVDNQRANEVAERLGKIASPQELNRNLQ